MKIKTSILQNMVAKAIKGASNNKMIPITSLIGIELKENILTLMTTDGSNHLRVKEKITNDDIDIMNGNVGMQEIYTVVNAETLSKLVSKTTTEFIELNIMENYLEVKGNGTYKLEIPMDEDGNVIKFKDISKLGNMESKQISIELLRKVLNTSKVSVAQTMEVPCLTGYYIGENKVITTDRQMVCNVEDKLLENPILISNEMAELLQLLEGETVNLYQGEKELIFETDKIQIYGKQLEGLDIYPVQAIENLLSKSYANCITVNKQEILNVLDRMSIFVSDYDKNGVYLKVEDGCLIITSQKSNANEYIGLDGEKDAIKPFNCLVDIFMLKSQIQALQNETVSIYYGEEKSIALKEENTTMILSLLDKGEN